VRATSRPFVGAMSLALRLPEDDELDAPEPFADIQTADEVEAAVRRCARYAEVAVIAGAPKDALGNPGGEVLELDLAAFKCLVDGGEHVRIGRPVGR
jgi:hypothetical protein